MSVLYRVALLVLLVLQSSNAEECEELTKRHQASEVDQILGNWVLMGAVANFSDANILLRNLWSTRIELHLNPDNKTISFTERIMLKSKSCSSFYTNFTVSNTDDSSLSLHAESFNMEENGTMIPLKLLAKGDVYQASPDCLIFTWDIVLDGIPAARYLLTCRREGTHQGADVLKAAQDHHEKRAKCLNFPAEDHFIYDGAAEFCPEKKAEDHMKDQQTLTIHHEAEGKNLDPVATE